MIKATCILLTAIFIQLTLLLEQVCNNKTSTSNGVQFFLWFVSWAMIGFGIAFAIGGH